MPRKGKPRVIQHRSMDKKDLAYYERRKHEIHILAPDAMFKRVLKHEVAHSRSRLTWFSGTFWAPPFYLLAFLLAFGSLIAMGLRLNIVWNTLGPAPTFLLAIASLYVLSNVFYWLEEIKAEREARRDRGKLRIIRSRFFQA